MLMKMRLSTTAVPKGMCSAIKQKLFVGMILLFSCAPQISNKKHYFTQAVNKHVSGHLFKKKINIESLAINIMQ